MSFHPSPEKFCEVLFMSDKAELNGTKAIRGGIPLVFPIFGPPSDPESDMPQHGFARTNVWKVDRSSINRTEDEASIAYTLDVKADDDLIMSRGTTGLWKPSADAPSCSLRYKITLTADSLITQLTATNTSTNGQAFPVQALFHTYYEVHQKAALDKTKTYVEGLKGYEKVDKVHPEKSCPEYSEDRVVVDGETDHVYHPPADKTELQVKIAIAHKYDLQCTCKASVADTPIPVSCVVWNPHSEKAKSMSDFGDQQYHEMICVEPGLLKSDTALEVGQTAVLEQTIQVLEGEC